MREEDKHGRHKRADSPRTGRTLAGTPGTAPGAAEEGLPSAAGADYEPGPDGDHLHHGGGDLHSAGRTGVGGEDNGKNYVRR